MVQFSSVAEMPCGAGVEGRGGVGLGLVGLGVAESAED